MDEEDPTADPTQDLETLSQPATPATNGMIGGFRIIRELGRGGMGVVYEAEQQHPKRPVALKVIRGGAFVDEMAVKLFEREAQALARLKHPSIAAIYDAGRTEDGQHYFAMELIRGETLSEWSAGRSSAGPLSRQEVRLRFGVVQRICEAVAYAHQRGVVHRDIKPTNVLVLREAVSTDASLAGVPDVKILDFGLARITDADVAASSVLTDAGVMQGTLRYMSPEQIRANPDEIDLRTDVYSLGVLLYELLTGQLPFDFKGHSLVEVARIICEEPPAHLSRHWSGPKKPDKDLETIVGKALEKNPADRYQSVTAMAEDLKRYLTRQPITARPPSAVYQLRKMVGRHTIGFAFAASVVVLLAVLAVTMSIQANSTARARDRAKQEAETADEVSSFLVELFQVSNPSEARGNSITAREILDKGAGDIKQGLQDQPRVQGRLMQTMGEVYRSLGLYDAARPLSEDGLDILVRELGEDHIQVATSRDNLALLLSKTGDYDGALVQFERALATMETRVGSESREVATLLNNMGDALLGKGEYEEARTLYERALVIRKKQLGLNHKDVAATLTNLAITLRALGRFEEGRPLAEQSLRIQEQELGLDHPDLAVTLNLLANINNKLGDYAAARPLYERTLAIYEKTLEPDHPSISTVLNNIGALHWNMKDYDAARPLFERSLEIREATYGPLHAKTGTAVFNLAELFKEMEDYDRARPLYLRALTIRESALGPESPRFGTTLVGYAELLLMTGDHRRAREYFERGLGILEQALGPEHLYVAYPLSGLGDLSLELGDHAAARAFYSRALDIRRQTLPKDHPEMVELVGKMSGLEAIGG